MIKKTCKALLATAILSILMMPSTFAASMTVLDYYRIIPTKFFLPVLRSFAGKTPSERDASLKVTPDDGGDGWEPQSEVDIENMYLRAPTKNSIGDSNEAIIVDIFTNKGQDLIVIDSHQCGLGKCAKQSVQFLKYSAGKWTSVKSEVLPLNLNKKLKEVALKRCEKKGVDSDSCLEYYTKKLIYTLPQEGTTIKIWFDNDPLYKLEWKGGKFKGSEWWEENTYFF